MFFFRKLYMRALKKKYRSIFILLFVFLMVNSWLMRAWEPDTFTSFYHAYWWVMTTITTVGYGDASPTSTWGRTWAMHVINPIGIGIFGGIVGIVSFVVHRRQKMKEEGKMEFKGRNHYVIIGWSPTSQEAIKELLFEEPETPIVLIDKLEKTPIEHDNVHYVQGSATSHEVLKQANIAYAKSALIFAPVNVEADYADGRTLLVASSIEDFDKGFEHNIWTVAEVLDENHVKNFKHANVDEYNLSRKSASHLMAKSGRMHGANQVFNRLLSFQNDDKSKELLELAPKKEWKTYRDAHDYLLKKKVQLLSDSNGSDILENLEKEIPSDVKLFVICTKQTLKSL